jgi:hypothetical protein
MPYDKPFEKKENDRGALWQRVGGKGMYMTGTVDGKPCVVFANKKKVPGDKQPDWVVLTPTPQEQREKKLRTEPEDDAPF